MAPAGPSSPDSTTRPTDATLWLGGETAVAPSPSQEQEEVGVAFKELQGYGSQGVSPDGVILGTDAQNWNGNFVYIP